MSAFEKGVQTVGTSEKKALFILVIDDNRYVRCLIARILKLHDHIVAEANSMHQALDIITRGMPELILSDINMPGANAAFFHAIRAQYPQIPIIAMSGTSVPPEVAAFRFEALVQKPFDIHSLLESVDSVCRV